MNENLQQTFTHEVIAPAQNGVNALSEARGRFGIAQEMIEGLRRGSDVRASGLQSSAELLEEAGQKTDAALMALRQVADKMQTIMARMGIEAPALNFLTPFSPNRDQTQPADKMPSSEATDQAKTEHQSQALPAGEYMQHAVVLYENILDNYAQKRNTSDKKATQAKQEWNTANRLMCEFALETQDLQLAGQCYGYIEDSGTKWRLVAKAYHAGYPLLAEDWQAPLRMEVERGDIDTRVLLAAQNARASMAFDRAALADDPRARNEQLREVDSAWAATSKLLENARGKTMVPKKPYSSGGIEEADGEVAAELDIRSYMLDFVKLSCAQGDFTRAKTIAAEITQLNKEIEYYSLPHSSEARRDTRDFLPTLELRELCHGLTASEVIKHAKTWSWRYPEGSCTAIVAKLIREPSPIYRSSDTPGLGEARHFIESTYPEISLTIHPDSGLDVAMSLRRNNWELAESSYHTKLKFRLRGQASLLEDALQLARREQDIKTASLAKSQADIATIHALQQSWQREYHNADVLDLPELRQAKLADIETQLKKTYATAEIQHQVFEALLAAQTEISPRSTLVQERITEYIEEKLKVLRSIPHYEQNLPQQVAALEALRQLTNRR